MKSYLKKKTVRIESMGEDLEIRMLPAGVQPKFAELGGSTVEGLALICQAGVVEWADETPESVQENLSVQMLGELAEQIFLHSGIEMDENTTADDSDGDNTPELLAVKN